MANQHIPGMEFLNELANDEEHFGSAEEYSDDDWSESGDPQNAMDQQVVGLCEVEMDIGNMPIMFPMGADTAINSVMAQFTEPDQLQESSTLQNRPEERDRSPLRSSTHPYNSLSSPTFDVFRDSGSADQELPETQQLNLRSPIGRGQSRTRGSPRSRGGNRGRGRRGSTRALDGDSEWRKGERVIEVCRNDEEIPPRLRDMVRELEASREKSAQQLKRRPNAKTNEEDESDDEYYDAESFLANELFNGDHDALKFEWSPMASFNGQREQFLPEHTGPTCNVSCPYEAFRQFWDDAILEHIVRETNRNAAVLKLSSSERFARDWYDTNVHEILILFAFWMMLGVIRMPTIKSCFSNMPILRTDVFRTLMTETRYWNLNRAIHLVDNATRTPDSSTLFSLGPIADHLNKKFMECYTPGPDISIDESLFFWKGNMSKQSLKSKSIKTFELCESSTGYLWSFFIDTGKEQPDQTSRLPKTAEAVIKLVRPLLNKGYRLFLDNWFNSPLLARFLKRNQTDCVGTLRKSRKGIPALIQLATIPEGSCIARHSGDVVVMAYQNKRLIYTISTCHGTESVHFDAKAGRAAHYKPAVIADYNSNTGGVDKKDQTLEPYLVERKKNRDWCKNFFKRLLNISVLNSRILVDRSRYEPVKHQAFRLGLVNEIMRRHLFNVPKLRQKIFRNTNDLPASRFTGEHFVVRSSVIFDRKTGINRTSLNRRNCLWCMVREKKYNKSVYMCDNCEVPLCLDGCFKKFHTIH